MLTKRGYAMIAAYRPVDDPLSHQGPALAQLGFLTNYEIDSFVSFFRQRKVPSSCQLLTL